MKLKGLLCEDRLGCLREEVIWTVFKINWERTVVIQCLLTAGGRTLKSEQAGDRHELIKGKYDQ